MIINRINATSSTAPRSTSSSGSIPRISNNAALPKRQIQVTPTPTTTQPSVTDNLFSKVKSTASDLLNKVKTVKIDSNLVIKGLEFAFSQPSQQLQNAVVNKVKSTKVETPKIKTPTINKDTIINAFKNSVNPAKSPSQVVTNSVVDFVSGFLGQNDAKYKSVGVEKQTIYTPKNNSQALGALANDLMSFQVSMEMGGINPAISQGTETLSATIKTSSILAPKVAFVQDAVSKFASKEFAIFLNKLKPIKLTFGDATAVTTGKATADQSARYAQALEYSNASGVSMKDIIAHSENMKVSPATRVYDFLKSSIESITKTLKSSLTPEETKLLTSGSKKGVETVIPPGEYTSQEVVGKVITNKLETTAEGKQLLKFATEAQNTGQNIVVKTAVDLSQPQTGGVGGKKLSQAEQLRQYEKEQGISTTGEPNTPEQLLKNTQDRIAELVRRREYLLKNIYTGDKPDIQRKAIGVLEDRIKELSKDEKVFSNQTLRHLDTNFGTKAGEIVAGDKTLSTSATNIQNHRPIIPQSLSQPQTGGVGVQPVGVISTTGKVTNAPTITSINESQITNVKTIKDVKTSLGNLQTEYSNLISEAQGKAALAQEQRSGLDTKAIGDLKRVYSVTKAFQEGDIETIRASKHGALVNSVIENVQEKYPDMTEQEAFDFAMGLPNKGAESIARVPELKNLAEKQKTLSKYLDLLKAKQTTLAGQQGNALYHEWQNVITAQEDLAKIIEVPKSQLPVGEGKLKASKLEARMKGVVGNATKEQINQLGLSTYNEMSKAEQMAKASEYVVNNQDEALKVLQGTVEPPKGIIPESIYVALTELAKDDITLATKLASFQATALGQRIGILSEINKDNPVVLLNEIYRVREAEFVKRTGKTVKQASDKIVKDIKAEIKVANKWDWNKFIDSIECP